MSKSWKGFEGRVFLEEYEHQTYLRRPPVRYSAKSLPASSVKSVCAVCGKMGSLDNPLQVAHRVPFTSGVLVWRLTPDWLDSPHNLVLAHRTACNRAAELDHRETALLVAELRQYPVYPPLMRLE